MEWSRSVPPPLGERTPCRPRGDHVLWCPFRAYPVPIGKASPPADKAETTETQTRGRSPTRWARRMQTPRGQHFGHGETLPALGEPGGVPLGEQTPQPTAGGHPDPGSRSGDPRGRKASPCFGASSSRRCMRSASSWGRARRTPPEGGGSAAAGFAPAWDETCYPILRVGQPPPPLGEEWLQHPEAFKGVGEL